MTTQFTYGVTDIIRRLGQEYRPGGALTSDAWRLGHIADLVTHNNFPEPLPLPKRADPRAICQRSRWIAVAVDDWFTGLLPTSAARADERAAFNAAANDMDRRANHLQLVTTHHGDAA